eukprot:1220505-Karenia_brevis.AAC.1
MIKRCVAISGICAVAQHVVSGRSSKTVFIFNIAQGKIRAGICSALQCLKSVTFHKLDIETLLAK